MITSRRTTGLLCTAIFIAAMLNIQAPQALGQHPNALRDPIGPSRGEVQHADQRISIAHARTATVRRAQPTRERQSLLARAATGKLVNQPEPVPLRDPKVEQVGYLQSYGSGCGPVCDCGHCGVEPVCGIDGPGCGFEVGCGMETVVPMNSCCGGMGCDQCCESTCGIEAACIGGPVCGMEPDCSCDACCDSGACSVPICLPMLRMNWCRWDFFAGVQGYTGPMNHLGSRLLDSRHSDGSGSFGFYQGFNEGRSLRRWIGCDIASQFGLRATQSNLSGAHFTNENRYQVFLTGGLFRKVDYGLQYGLVFDYLNQDWFFQGDSIQLRGELSWRHDACHVCGFRFMSGLRNESSNTIFRDGNGNLQGSLTFFEPTDQYRLFYRRLLARGGECTAFAGWTDRDDGLLGTNLSVPLRPHLLLAAGATYLIPNEGTSRGGYEEEGWNISLGFVFRPGGPQGCGRYCRPMFDVADNGSFMLDRR